ncbi:MAG: LCP family protein [Nitriliruptorales bacterium]|nr:LCP family protein [Nitriliruptorales bacterium]
MLVGLLVATGAALWWYTDTRVDRTTIDAIEDDGTEEEEEEEENGAPVEFLVVGSDDRSELTEEQQAELSTGGDMGPIRTDVILVVQVRPDTGEASLLSIPRDLLVDLHGADVKINSVLARSGRDQFVELVEDLVQVELDHYLEVSIPSFLEVVEAVGGVELCLDEPLVDEDAGAELAAGCQELDAAESLAFVRSRQGARGDFRRIERQQRFLRALIEEMTSARTAVDLPRLFRLANRVAGSLTTDQDLSLGDLRNLAQRLEDLAAGDVEAATLPAYATDGGLRLYGPGARAFVAAFERGEPLPATGSRSERAAADVIVWSAGSPQLAQQVASVLFFYGFSPQRRSGLPIQALGVEVFASADADGPATWVANVLGVEPSDPPDVVDVDSDAVVAVGG